VARLYAGLLGLLAFLTILVRGILHRGDPEMVLWSAWCHLLAFALVGVVVGWLAGWIVEDAIRSRVATATAARRHVAMLPSGARPRVGR
jgi:hypothetical protein